ncbi:MAG: mechanosensitive ion channel family protein [Tissierellaceae bacterium]|nr:mechanosensitive ion channel family protein [Tissierellaceae bacterium]
MENINTLFNDYLRTSEGNINIFGKLIIVVLIFLGVGIISRLINRIIDRTLKIENKNLKINIKRTNTLVSTLKKLIKYILIFIGIIMTLELFEINTASILATAGIGGLAIGFGAQSLVKDIITGFFILLEDQYSVGDYIETGDKDGIVEELGLRVTKLRAFSGELHIIPNSSINIVTNKARGAMRALVVVSISIEEDVDRTIFVLQNALKSLESDDRIVEGPNVLGVSNIGEYNVDITIVAKTKAMEQWGVERQIRQISNETLHKENIKRPYPKREIVGGDIE